MSGTDLKQRLVVILAADAAGYSRLMSLDERATVAALDTARAVFRQRIELNRGRVIDMAGDSVLAVFETATGAVSAALAIQQELETTVPDIPEDRRMRFRIGVHLGDVIEKMDGTVRAWRMRLSEGAPAATAGKAMSQAADANLSGPAVSNSELSLPDKPSIAVLPFSNMSGDPEQEYFTDGVTEDIITELSRFHSLFVIARNSTFTYKGKAVDVRTVARELGVRYVLEGSIRRAANRVLRTE